jgi:hypothetical protein
MVIGGCQEIESWFIKVCRQIDGVDLQNQQITVLNNEIQIRERYPVPLRCIKTILKKTIFKACLKTVRKAQFWTEAHPGLCRGTAWTWPVAATGLVNNITVFLARLVNLKRMSPRDTYLIVFKG